MSRAIVERGHRSESYGAKGRTTLTRADVIGAAVELVDEVGPEGLSMRALARRLNTGPSTLYWHVRDKDQLLSLVLEETISKVQVPGSGTWQDRLTGLLDDCRLALAARPALVPVILGARWDVGHHALRVADAALTLLAEAGLDGEQIGDAYFVLLHYTLGFVEAEAHARWNATFGAEHSDADTSPVDDSELTPFEALRTHGPATAPSDMDRRFHFGLAVILRGLVS